MMTRQQMWEGLPEQVDLVVIGGGITGAGVARDAARRGLTVALFEMNDLAFGTSSRSSKLVHGGLRYLEQYEFSLVFESVSERRVLLEIAPHLVRPLGFLFPVFEGSRQPLWMIEAGMWLYDGLSLFRSPKMHKRYSRKELAQVEPGLSQKGLKGAPLYYDCATDDARLTLEAAMDAARSGAHIVSRARVAELITGADGRIDEVRVVDTLSGEEKTIRAHAVVNATGPWTDDTLKMSKAGPGQELLRPTKGVHIVVRRDRVGLEHAVVCFHPDDGRVLFILPWGEHCYIGTTDTDDPEDPARICATAADVKYLVDVTNVYFPEARLEAGDVISTWAGLRPLIRPLEGGADVDESAVSREHQILVGRDGLITIAGGKLTTFRKMAAEVVERVDEYLKLTGVHTGRMRPAHTDVEPLPGAVGWPPDARSEESLAQQVVRMSEGLIEDDTARMLIYSYGTRALALAGEVARNPSWATRLLEDRPEIEAQVYFGHAHELASEVADILVRRTQIHYRHVDQGLPCVDRVAEILGELQGWSEERRARSAEEYRDEVALSRRWREQPWPT